jgi:hypothetical protein
MKENERGFLELEAVTEIVHALDVTIHEPEGPETRDCILHGVEFLEDHLRRLYQMEESHGLLDIVIRLHPELAHEAHRLEAERACVQAAAHRLVQHLADAHNPSDESLHGLMRELRRLIAGILKHEHHERSALLDAVNLDRSGGEG